MYNALATTTRKRENDMLRKIVTFAFLISVVAPCPGLSQVQAPGQRSEGETGPDRTPFPPVRKVGPGLLRLGEIQIHKGSMSVTFPAVVNMDRGLIEYLLVRSTGKIHESLLRTEVDPYLLNISFLLLGFEGTDRPLDAQGAADKPGGDPVSIILVYNQAERNQSVPAEGWIVRKNGEHAFPPEMSWVYTGSMVMQGRFLASQQGSIAAVYHDPAALIDHGAPGGESDEIWFVREGTVPPVGTPVTVVVKKLDR